MKKLVLSSVAAVLVLAAGAAWAQCARGGAQGCPAGMTGGAKLTCACMHVQGLTLTAEQQAKVDALQAKCKAGCQAGCCKACAAEMKNILTAEQLKVWEQNCAACKRPGKCPMRAAPATTAPAAK